MRARPLQKFLVTADWQHEATRSKLQRRVASVIDELPDDPMGTVGRFVETSCLKKGDRTPGGQRQYLACVGKIDYSTVTVYVEVAKGRFWAPLGMDLYLPKPWGADRERCAEAGITDEVRYRPKWPIAYCQGRLDAYGVRFDWLVFDEGCGSKVPLLRVLLMVGQKFVGEVPVSFSVSTDGARRSNGRRGADGDQCQVGASISAGTGHHPGSVH